MAQLGQQLASGLDQVRVVAASAEGVNRWSKHFAAMDANAVGDFVDACVGNYDELMKTAAR